jgi:phosphoketolase
LQLCYRAFRRGESVLASGICANLAAKERTRNLQIECRNYAHEHGLDRPAERDWEWPH